jgi:hypothetical protein
MSSIIALVIALKDILRSESVNRMNVRVRLPTFLLELVGRGAKPCYKIFGFLIIVLLRLMMHF